MENPFEQYIYRGYYSTIYAEGQTDEYCAIEDSNPPSLISRLVEKILWAMVGHVYFDRAFRRNLRKFRNRVWHEPYREQLWEDYYSRHVRELLLEARHYSADIVKEFDSLDELRQFDDRYLEM